ncbi:MAG: GNAT family N-acetyltransferase [Clostridiales bacterium]|nr:GNAT family N-acetyltransferase [Clostridiales bacterium]
MRIEIIKGQEMHLEEIVELIRNSEIVKLYFPNTDVQRILKKAIEKNRVYLALKKNQVVGFIWYSQDGTFSKYPYLHLIIVCPKQREKGYGRELINFFESKLCENYNKVS